MATDLISVDCVCRTPHAKKIKDISVMTNFNLIGKGTYGAVYRAMDTTQNGDWVALKMIKMEKETQGFPVTAIREIKFLKQLKHENIVNLRDILSYSAEDDKSEAAKPEFGFLKGDVFMVLDYMDYDLSGLLESPGVELTEDHIRSYAKQLLEGVFFMHQKNVLHRDM